MTSTILRIHSSVLTGLLAVLSVFYLLRGHHAPGGGFVGGLLFASAVTLRALSHDVRDARARLRVDPRTLIGIGLAIAVSAAFIGAVAGGAFFEPVEAFHVPAIGTIGTVLMFDLGVYVLIAGAVLTILLALLEEEP